MAGSTEGSSALQDSGPNITMTPGGKSGGDSSAPESAGYRNIRQSINDSMRPDFTGQAMTPNGETPEQRRFKIRMNLRGAEGSAANQGSTSGLDAQSGENNVSSGFTNNVGKGGSVQGSRAQKSNVDNSSKDDKSGGFLKKKGPIISIILSLAFGGGGMFLSQSALPFTMLDKLNGNFDSTNVSTTMRSKAWFKSMVRNNKNPTAVTRTTLFGKEKFKPTGRMKKKLAKNGITFSDGNMIYKNKSGSTEVLDVDKFKQKLDTDADFKTAYEGGTKTWRTSVAEFKDKMFDKLLKKFGLSKNKFEGYDPESDPDGSKARKVMTDTVGDATDIGKVKSQEDGDPVFDETGKRLDPVTGEPIGNEGKLLPGDKPPAELDNPVENPDPEVMGGKLKNSLSKVAGFTSFACGATKVLSALSVILAAYQMAQVIAVAQTLFEGVDKAKTEDADSSPINAIGKSLTVQTSEERMDVELGVVNDADNSYSTATYTTRNTEMKSAVQSEGFSSLYTGDPIDPEDESVLSFNPTNAANKAISGSIMDYASSAFAGGLGTISGVNKVFDFISEKTVEQGLSAVVGGMTAFSRMSYITCVEFEGILAVVDTVIDTATTVGIIAGILAAPVTAGASLAESGASAAIKEAWKLLKKLAKKALIAILVGLAVSIGVKILTNMLMRKVATDFFGEDLGNALNSGGHSLMGRNHRAGGGLVANKDGYLASLIYGEQVNRETAEYERLARSPFDYTSQYTFAGQLASTLIPVTLQSSSLLDSFDKFGTVVGNSVKSFLPGASAASAAEKAEIAEQQTEENCPEMHDIGIVADAYCNPYITTDFDTIDISDNGDDDTDPNSAYNIIKKVGNISGKNFKDSNIDDVENPEINMGEGDAKDSGDLGKYVVYCGQRDSPFGQPDQNVIADLDSGSVGSTVGDAALGVVPIVGGLMDLATSTSTLANWGWIDGSNCVMGHDMNTGFNVAQRVSYDDIKYYNRYAEDQRLASAMGVVDKSAVDVALEEYYEAHPVDTSMLGLVSRFSGYTKENVVAVMDAADVLSFIAQYDPTDLYPTPKAYEEPADYRLEDDRFIDDDGLLAVMRYSYSDVYRQRNFATA